jgi:HEAT repeat protein
MKIRRAAVFVVATSVACINGPPERSMGEYEQLQGPELDRARQHYAHGRPAEGREILRTLIAHADWNVRSRAVRVAGEVSDTALLPDMHAALGDERVEVRESVSRVLQSLGTEESLPVLIGATKDRESIVRSNAAEAIARIAPLAAQATLESLLFEDPDPNVRAILAMSLGETGNRSYIPALIRALGDSESVVRAHAATALGRIGSGDAETALRRALNDPDPQVRRSAESALRQLQP